jgi:hypothetical protein
MGDLRNRIKELINHRKSKVKHLGRKPIKEQNEMLWPHFKNNYRTFQRRF